MFSGLEILMLKINQITSLIETLKRKNIQFNPQT